MVKSHKSFMHNHMYQFINLMRDLHWFTSQSGRVSDQIGQSSLLFVQDILWLSLRDTPLSVDSRLPIALCDRSRSCLSCLNAVGILLMGFHFCFSLNPSSLLQLFPSNHICQLYQPGVMAGI